MSAALSLEVRGVALWAPSLPGWQAACDVLHGRASAPAAPASRPSPALLAPTERRRAPDTVALALEVAVRACAMAGVAPASLPSVFASTHGDLPINDYMCATLAATPQLLSPTKFHNSVHNAAAGYWTIGTGCTEPSTALTAWDDTFAAGLLEAGAQAVADGTPVLLVAYDVAARGPLATVTRSDGLLAAALVLAPAGWAGTRAARATEAQPAEAPAWTPRTLSLEVLAGAPPPATDAGAGPWQALAPGNAMAPCLPLLAALSRPDAATLHARVGRGSHLAVRLGASA